MFLQEKAPRLTQPTTAGLLTTSGDGPTIEETGRWNSTDVLRLNPLFQVSTVFSFCLRNSAFALSVRIVPAASPPDSNA